MADTFTANLVLTKPEIGASTDTWGTKLNANSDTIANLFQAGPTLKITSGGTGATTASAARTNLGLGSMATQAASAVAITGGTAVLSDIRASSVAPNIGLNETDASTNNKNWFFIADNGTLTLRLYDDAISGYNNLFIATRSGTSPSAINFGATVQVNGATVFHTSNISSATILETQISDGSTFPRLASSETITGTWNFTSVPQKTSGGKFIHYASSTYNSGAVTVSTSDPTGTPGEGDRWVKYTA